MWGLIVSLLFLSPILDGFQALDGSGRPLPHAVLTFLRSGTTIPKAVYADQDLEVELSDAAGRVTADAQGRFPLIYLAYDPTPRYRVMLHTAEGVLRWDIDPYLCDCTDPPYLFRGPKHQALDESGRPLAGARLIFSITETETPARTYADAELTVPHPNPLVADSGGFFPPVYLDDDITYRVRLTDRRGELLLDVDPYICECGFLLLTSQPYPAEVLDGLANDGTLKRGIWAPVSADGSTSLGYVLNGTLVAPVVTYEIPPEAIESVGEVTGGELKAPLVPYEIPEEAIESEGYVIAGGTLIDVLVNYSMDPEAIESLGEVVAGGTLA